MRDAVARHWPEYLMEAAGLGIFMLSAGGFAIVLFHPASPVALALAEPLGRRLVMGCAMGLTAVCLIYSPWGQQSGAHFNPAVTLTFLRLGKIAAPDAFFYVIAQIAGGVGGILTVALAARGLLANPAVNYVVTVPGAAGPRAAFAAELAMSLALMSVVLAVSSAPRIARYTGVFAGMLVATYITVEAPISGMSMNPARSLASAVAADLWTAFWIYVTAPLIGMLLAAELRLRLWPRPVRCAKLHHDNRRRCIFRCGYAR
jgi:aquaporin Z